MKTSGRCPVAYVGAGTAVPGPGGPGPGGYPRRDRAPPGRATGFRRTGVRPSAWRAASSRVRPRTSRRGHPRSARTTAVRAPGSRSFSCQPSGPPVRRLHSSSSAPGGRCLVPHTLKTRRKALPPHRTNALSSVSPGGLGAVDSRAADLGRLSPGQGRVRCSADVQFVRVVFGELHVRRRIGHTERLERGEELLGGPPVHMGLGLPHGHHVEPVLVRAGRPREQAVDILGRVVLGGDRTEALDRYPGRRCDVDVGHVALPFLSLRWQEGRYGRDRFPPSAEPLTGVLIEGRPGYSLTARAMLSSSPGGDLTT